MLRATSSQHVIDAGGRHRRAWSRKSSDLREPRAYSIREYCDPSGIGRSQAYVEIANGRLRIRKVGRRTIIAVEDAEAWFASCARPE
jgi:hypothetical protein